MSVEQVTLDPFSRLVCMTAGKVQNDAFSDHWRQTCEERGHPIPKRRPNSYRAKPPPGTVDDDEQP